MPTEALSFADDGDVPNHPHWPMIVYAQAIAPETLQKSENAFDELFELNGWPVAWHNGIYPFTHYHSTTHEVLGIARGEATVQFGGKSGKILTARAGDALLLPAGTGHKRMSSSPDLLVIGAYPPGSKYDLMRSGESDKAGIRARIAKIARPDTDPVSGADGAMLSLWIENQVDGTGPGLAQQQGSVLRHHTVKSLTGNTVRTTQMGPKP